MAHRVEGFDEADRRQRALQALERIGIVDRPTCDFDDVPADYHDPILDQDLCKDHALSTGALTNARCWQWNDRRKCWDR